MSEFIGRATYSPEDNKIRIYPFSRLDAETYAKVKAAGFTWAPKQELFVAPTWTPPREDLAFSLCGEIGDEDTSLVERAEIKAERLENLSERKGVEGERLYSDLQGAAAGGSVVVAANNSRKAEKEKARVERTLTKALSAFEAVGYWKDRAAGALRHAKYKERPDVRARRIKGLEADLRKQEKVQAERAKIFDAVCKIDSVEKLRWLYRNTNVGSPIKLGERLEAGDAVESIVLDLKDHYGMPDTWAKRWAEHYRGRLEYEREMLGVSGGLVAEKFDIQPGGRIETGGEWFSVIRVNRKAGKVVSVRCSRRFVPIISIEDISDYSAPTEETVAAVKAATKLPPMVNVPGEGVLEMTAAEWKEKTKVSDSYYTKRVPESETAGAHRRRATLGERWSRVWVYLTDEKRVEIPAPRAPEVREDAAATLASALAARAPEVREYVRPEPTAAELRAKELREAVKTGVVVAVAPQLFPTPRELAARMIEEANIQPWGLTLEPSAGTGRLVDAAFSAAVHVRIVAVENEPGMARALRAGNKCEDVICADFMTWDTSARFDRVVMNPPFANGQDIAHIRRAFDLLKPGGRLVAICAGGPRQAAQLLPWVESLGGTWEPLPAGTFKESGTNVSSVLLVVDHP